MLLLLIVDCFKVIMSSNNFIYYSSLCIDVIGFFTRVGTERQYERNGVPVKMNVIELESDGYHIYKLIFVVQLSISLNYLQTFCHFASNSYRYKIECALFGQYVDDLNSFLATGEVQRPVVILQLAKVKPFHGIRIVTCIYTVVIL